MVNSFLLYLLQSSFTFGLLYLCFRVLVADLTFYRLNRVLLVSLPICSVLLPLIDWNFEWAMAQTDIPFKTVRATLFAEGVPNNMAAPTDTQTLRIGVLFPIGLLSLYALGTVVRLIFLLFQLRQFFRLKGDSIRDDYKGIRVLRCNVAMPFSFFNCIYLPKSMAGKTEKMVLAHEAAHVRLGHSFDSILIALYHCCFWFNPLVHSYRKSVRSLHEFQADHAVLKGAVRPSDYLQLLRNTVQTTARNVSPVSYFNNTMIKKRIIMMTKIKSKQTAMLKYIPIFLVVVGISFGFSVTADTVSIPEPFGVPVKKWMKEPPSIFPIANAKKDGITSFYGQKVRQPKTGSILIHKGIDIKAIEGTPVLATADGTVLSAKNENDWGNHLVLEHADGYQTHYAHLEDFNVEENATVAKGEVIGYVGSTGKSSGPHLHYEVRRNGQSLDPMDFFEE